MRNLLVLCVLATTLLLSGCGKPTVDCSSPEAWKESIKEVRESLELEDLDTLTGALMVRGMAAGFSQKPGDEPLTPDKVFADLDGKTGEEIVREIREAEAKTKE